MLAVVHEQQHDECVRQARLMQSRKVRWSMRKRPDHLSKGVDCVLLRTKHLLVCSCWLRIISFYYYKSRDTGLWTHYLQQQLHHGTAWHSMAQHSTAQHSSAQHSSAQHSSAQQSSQHNMCIMFSEGVVQVTRQHIPYCHMIPYC